LLRKLKMAFRFAKQRFLALQKEKKSVTLRGSAFRRKIAKFRGVFATFLHTYIGHTPASPLTISINLR
jgi:hypothetical protein